MRKQATQSLSFTIRLACYKDARTISSLYFEWLKFGEEKARVREIEKAIRTKGITVALNRHHEIIGFIQGTILNDPISSGPILYIQSFYVRRGFRNVGIGSRLILALFSRSRKLGAVAAEVATAQDPAYRLYRRFGFMRYRGDFKEVHLSLIFRERNLLRLRYFQELSSPGHKN